jgi:hypothetical protein
VKAHLILDHKIRENAFHRQIHGRRILNVRGDLIGDRDDQVAQCGLNNLSPAHFTSMRLANKTDFQPGARAVPRLSSAKHIVAGWVTTKRGALPSVIRINGPSIVDTNQ